MKHINIKAFAASALLFCAGVPSMQAQNDYQFVRTAATPAFQTDFTQAAEMTINSVVCIKSYVSRVQQQYYDPFSDMMDPFEFFFGTPRQRQQPKNKQQQKKGEPTQSGLGSGVIIREDGYIVTNNHVIDGADKVEVILNDNRSYEAKIIGTDEATDLALIKIDATGLKPVVFGDSDAVKVGEWVLAVGNPFGFNSTVTAGIVSAKARSISSGNGAKRLGLDSYIQTDAALNPGNSGGALVNLNGQLIGINAAIYSNTGSYTGFSFAIPTSVVKKIISDIKEYGTVQRAVLGIRYQELDAKLAKEKDVKGTVAGIYVTDVEDLSTAREIDLEEGDVITKINGNDVHTSAQLIEQMNQFRPGDKITITYLRDGKQYTKSATLKNDRGNTNITKKDDFSSLGCAFMKITAETKKHLGISHGVQVSGLKNGPIKEAGIKDGFIIMSINDNPVNSSDDVEYLYDQIMQGSRGERVMFITGIYTTGKKGYYAVNLSTEE
ncbi:MAG: Do family serine endopeptidase [Prevotella sp.]|nr:Do family serine endopeptidase [Prevotella sp.]MCM1075382.1 Do family serine endopeptidase [Ruminococcus sp.]